MLPFTQACFPLQVLIVWLLSHCRVQSAVRQTHSASPPHFSVQPPSAQLTRQMELPVQSTVDDGRSVTRQSLPPPHATLEFEPVVMSQSDDPVHDAVELSPMFWSQVLFELHEVVQLLAQAPMQVVLFVHFESQFVPHATLQVESFSQVIVWFEGSAAREPPSAPPLIVHVPPAVQVQLSPVH